MPPIASKQFEELFVFLNILFTPEVVGEIVADAANTIGLEAVDRLGRIYPPKEPRRTKKGKPSNYRSPLHTEKQLKWWWASMHAIARGEPVSESLRGWQTSYQTIKGRKTLVFDPKSGYKRTGTMVRSITYEVEASGDTVTLSVGPSMARQAIGEVEADYAQFVLDLPPPEGKQSVVHQDRWVPLITAINKMSDDLFEMFEEEAIENLRRRMKGRGYSYTGMAIK